jgi:hypothetical protein
MTDAPQEKDLLSKIGDWLQSLEPSKIAPMAHGPTMDQVLTQLAYDKDQERKAAFQASLLGGSMGQGINPSATSGMAAFEQAQSHDPNYARQMGVEAVPLGLGPRLMANIRAAGGEDFQPAFDDELSKSNTFAADNPHTSAMAAGAGGDALMPLSMIGGGAVAGLARGVPLAGAVKGAGSLGAMLAERPLASAAINGAVGSGSSYLGHPDRPLESHAIAGGVGAVGSLLASGILRRLGAGEQATPTPQSLQAGAPERAATEPQLPFPESQTNLTGGAQIAPPQGLGPKLLPTPGQRPGLSSSLPSPAYLSDVANVKAASQAGKLITPLDDMAQHIASKHGVDIATVTRDLQGGKPSSSPPPIKPPTQSQVNSDAGTPTYGGPYIPGDYPLAPKQRVGPVQPAPDVPVPPPGPPEPPAPAPVPRDRVTRQILDNERKKQALQSLSDHLAENNIDVRTIKGANQAKTIMGDDLSNANATSVLKYAQTRAQDADKANLTVAQHLANIAKDPATWFPAVVGAVGGGAAVKAMIGSGGQLHNTENGQFVSPDDPNARVGRMRAAAALALRGAQ